METQNHESASLIFTGGLAIRSLRVALASLSLLIQQVSISVWALFLSVDKVGTLRESKTVALGFMKPILPSHQSHVTEWG